MVRINYFTNCIINFNTLNSDSGTKNKISVNLKDPFLSPPPVLLQRNPEFIKILVFRPKMSFIQTFSSPRLRNDGLFLLI